ncbi:15708_t:CDS:1, partial [Dentiscutata heterogama]
SNESMSLELVGFHWIHSEIILNGSRVVLHSSQWINVPTLPTGDPWVDPWVACKLAHRLTHSFVSEDKSA